MTIAYLDCSSGIAGDMLVAALLDVGLSFERLKEELSQLPLKGYELAAREVKKCDFRGLHFSVKYQDDQPHRHYSDIKKMIESTQWSTPIKEKALSIFKTLGEAEARVHGTKIEDIHFHEIGAVDSIIDICAVAIGFHHLGITELHASPVNVGGGEIKTAHGTVSVPAPATLELAKNIPIYSRHVETEISTPTGMAVLSALAINFGSFPSCKPIKIGCGVGTKDLQIPNILRFTIAEKTFQRQGTDKILSTDQVIEITADIDDMNPEWYEHIISVLFKAGALDVVMLPVHMKKNRLATRLNVLAREIDFETLSEIILRETTSLGLRYNILNRLTLQREIIIKETQFGPVRFKQAWLEGENLYSKAEYDDCARIAKVHDMPIKDVYAKITTV